MNLQELQISEQDFDLIIEGLDAIPEKGMAGEIMSHLFEGLLTRDNPETKEKAEQDRLRREEKRKREVQVRKDDIAILKGKLAMLKRYLATSGALKSVDDIVNPLK